MNKKPIDSGYSGLNLLPTPILEEIIRSDFENEAEYDSELIAYATGLLAERKKEENAQSAPDVQEAWDRFQERLAAEEATDLQPQVQAKSRKKASRKKIFRCVGIVAACLVLVCSVLIGVQAMGINIFGGIGGWTDGMFFFRPADGSDVDLPVDVRDTEAPHLSRAPSPDEPIKQALTEAGLPVELSPTWVPEGYEFSQINTNKTEFLLSVCAVFYKPNATHNCIICIKEFYSEEFLYNGTYEKDEDPPNVYTVNGRTFYVFKNASTWTGAWTDGRYSIMIAGLPTEEMVVQIINSIP